MKGNAGAEDGRGTDTPIDGAETAMHATSERQALAQDVMAAAAETIEQRGPDHGAAEQLEHNAALWSAHLGAEITPTDYCLLMALTKISRAECGDTGRQDHYEDAIGYLGWAWAMEASR